MVVPTGLFFSPPKAVRRAAVTPKPADTPPAKSPTTVATADTATISGTSQIAPKPTSDTMVVEADAPKDPDQQICGQMSQLFGVDFYDGKGGLGEYLRAHPKGIDIHSPEFKAKLAKWLGIPEDLITDKALDYFFGNQDGKLDKKDFITKAQLIDRLKFLVPIFAAMREAGGDTAIQYLRAEDIITYDYKPEYLAGVNFEELYKAKDPLFMECIKIAAKAYINSPGATTEGKQKAMSILGYGEDWKGEVPDELKPYLHAAYYGKFRAATYKIDLPYESLKKTPGLKDAFFKGVFLDFVDGHSAPNNPTKITHDVPTGSALRTERDGPKWLKKTPILGPIFSLLMPKNTVLTEKAIIDAVKSHEKAQKAAENAAENQDQMPADNNKPQ